MDPNRALQLIRKLKESSCCSEDSLINIINTPKIKERFSDRSDKLAKIIPFFENWAKRQGKKPKTFSSHDSQKAPSPDYTPISHAPTQAAMRKPWGSWKWYNRNRHY